ncbi:hypothetical protein OAO92_11270, partial [Paracoccaceae bacterium]|nr:hypothetical protein [Paracoccaceae bacterium]
MLRLVEFEAEKLEAIKRLQNELEAMLPVFEEADGVILSMISSNALTLHGINHGLNRHRSHGSPCGGNISGRNLLAAFMGDNI